MGIYIELVCSIRNDCFPDHPILIVSLCLSCQCFRSSFVFGAPNSQGFPVPTDSPMDLDFDSCDSDEGVGTRRRRLLHKRPASSNDGRTLQKKTPTIISCRCTSAPRRTALPSESERTVVAGNRSSWR